MYLMLSYNVHIEAAFMEVKTVRSVLRTVTLFTGPLMTGEMLL